MMLLLEIFTRSMLFILMVYMIKTVIQDIKNYIKK